MVVGRKIVLTRTPPARHRGSRPAGTSRTSCGTSLAPGALRLLVATCGTGVGHVSSSLAQVPLATMPAYRRGVVRGIGVVQHTLRHLRGTSTRPSSACSQGTAWAAGLLRGTLATSTEGK